MEEEERLGDRSKPAAEVPNLESFNTRIFDPPSKLSKTKWDTRGIEMTSSLVGFGGNHYRRPKDGTNVPRKVASDHIIGGNLTS